MGRIQRHEARKCRTAVDILLPVGPLFGLTCWTNLNPSLLKIIGIPTYLKIRCQRHNNSTTELVSCFVVVDMYCIGRLLWCRPTDLHRGACDVIRCDCESLIQWPLYSSITVPMYIHHVIIVVNSCTAPTSNKVAELVFLMMHHCAKITCFLPRVLLTNRQTFWWLGSYVWAFISTACYCSIRL